MSTPFYATQGTLTTNNPHTGEVEARQSVLAVISSCRINLDLRMIK
ncbi:MAG: hypothetical protein R2784_09565 [Saprospiraceae bacterium]